MEQKMINLTIDNVPVSVPEGTTVLEAARNAGIKIPTLCYLKDINEIGACRMCVVEVKGARSLMASCVYPVAEGMEVFTNTPKVRHSRQLTLELILSNHRMDCLTCARNAHCELRQRPAPSPAGDHRSPPGAGQLQVHPLPPLHRHVQQGPAGGCHRLQRPGLCHPCGSRL